MLFSYLKTAAFVAVSTLLSSAVAFTQDNAQATQERCLDFIRGTAIVPDASSCQEPLSATVLDINDPALRDMIVSMAQQKGIIIENGDQGNTLEAGYPEWIAERFCAKQQALENCRGRLRIADLTAENGRIIGDPDPNGEMEQWGRPETYPRLAQCTYKHPDHPNWNSTDECFYTVTTHVAGNLTTTQRVGVKNGNSFWLEHVQSQEDPDQYSANGHNAFLTTHDGNTCYSVIETSELFCVVPAFDTPGTNSTRNTDDSVSQNNADLKANGMCSVYTARQRVDYEPCREENHCRVGEASGEASCMTVYHWPSGNTTVLEVSEVFINSINQHPAHNVESPTRQMGESCAKNLTTGNVFCFSAF